MKELSERIKGEMFSALISFVAEGGEASLERAYALGREAAEGKLELLKVADAYVTALTEITGPISQESARTIAATRELLSASLAPFEMTHRGYRESVARLQKLNSALEHQQVLLESANRELESFSYSVSHDLRAPVRAIGGFARILKEDHSGSLNPEAQTLLSRIERLATQMGELIEGLLSLARLGRQGLSLEKVDLSVLANGLFAELRRTAPERKASLEVTPGLVVRVDRSLLTVVLDNLLSNAWKYTAKVPVAQIEFGRDLLKKDSPFFVRDNGDGFDMKYTERLFLPFQRLHSVDEFEGIGIGLATVRRIIERHGGKIWAQATKGCGATFYFTLSADSAND